MELENQYRPWDRKIVLRPDASLYARFHEEAHREQHETNSVVFWAWASLHFLRGIGWVVTVWIEWDANRRARRAMEKAGLWTKDAQSEARHSIMSYIKRRETT